MFTFHWSELLVVVISALALFFGLALLILRRRNEVIQDFLTPEGFDLEEEFFRVRMPPQPEEPPEEEDAAQETNTDETAEDLLDNASDNADL